MKQTIRLLLLILIISTTSQVGAQYWVRGDITIADADFLGGFNASLEIRINSNAIIDLSTMSDGNMNSTGRTQIISRAYTGSFPNSIQFVDYMSGASISSGDGNTNGCYGNFGGSSTNNATTNGTLFLGPYSQQGIGNNTYFGCDEIIQNNVIQTFQVWKLKNLVQPSDNSVCTEQSIILNPGNWGSSIKRVLYNTNTMGNYQPLATFSTPVSSYTVDLNTLPNLTLPGTVRFRLDYGNGILSNSVIYNVTGCSPEVTNIDVSDPNCSYDEGMFTLTFEEALNGDTLTNIAVIGPGPNGMFDDPENLNNDDVIMDTVTYDIAVPGDQFTYPNSLPVGTYAFRYQTNGSDTDQQTMPFTITAPPALEYSVQIESEITCNDADDGKIRITINPNNNGSLGTPPYNYVLSNGNTGNFSGNSTTVSSFIAGETTIQVFDSQNCTERE
ncbi:hypothetical protein [uncultured Dokdonia sp.]|uniref:hypothetical protein n=1 Tax=uncultured Dokdonia sp. TaxID=575653 RepID=UPI0030ED866E